MNHVKSPLLLSLLFIATLFTSACSDDKKSAENAGKEDKIQETKQEATQEKAKKENSTINGTISYSETTQPPAGSKLHIHLNNVSLADASSTNMEEQIFDLANHSVPFKYEFSIPEGSLKAKESYAVRAEIRGADNGLLWTTDTNNPVDAAKTSQTLDEIVMISVTPVTASDSIMDLININWKVNDINGAGVVDSSESSVTFSTDGKLSGLAGCNNYNGNYKLRDGKLSIEPLAVTKKACSPELNGQEIRFLNVIGSVDDFSFDSEGALTLKTADGKTLSAKRP